MRNTWTRWNEINQLSTVTSNRVGPCLYEKLSSFRKNDNGIVHETTVTFCQAASHNMNPCWPRSMIYKLRSVQNTGTCYPGQGWFVRNQEADRPKPRCTWQIQHTFSIFFYSPVGLVGNFAGLPSCRVSSAIVHWNQNEAGQQTIKAPSMPCWGAVSPWKHSLAFMPQDWWNWLIKWIKSVSMGNYQYKNKVNGEFFAYPVSNFTVFQPRI